MGSISTTATGNMYTIIGSTAEAVVELNRKQVNIDRVQIAAPNGKEIICIVGSK